MKKKVIVILSVFILIIAAILTYKYINSYNYYEKSIIKATKRYIEDKKNVINKETYININELSIEIKDQCDVTSGVIVDENNDYHVYLSCTDYENRSINTKKSKYSLNGKEIVIMPLGVNYVEKGLKEKSIDYDIQGNVENEVGVYNLKYIIKDEGNSPTILTRKVIVVDNKEISDLYPTLNLIGEEVITIDEGTNYEDPGVIAMDNNDKDIATKIEIDENIDINKIGKYEVIYIVTNLFGYSNSITRKVIVISKYSTTVLKSTLSETKPTNKDVTIKLEIEGEDYSYVEFPDGSTTNERVTYYKVTKNGTYNFITHDNNNKSASFKVEVNNIDKVAPTGTCAATVYPTYTNILVNKKAEEQIIEYGYVVNDKLIQTNAINSYKYNKTDIKNIAVNIKDNASNVSKITCSVKYIDPSMNNPNVTYYTKYNTEYVIPKTPNTLDNFISKVRSRISQNAPGADEYNCGNKCDIVSKYYVYYWKYVKDLYSMTLYDACVYGYSKHISYNTIYEKDLNKYMKLIYNEISAGRPVVAKVMNVDIKTQHYVMVVGYKRNVYDPNNIKKTDFLVVDPHAGIIMCTDNSFDKKAFWFLERTNGYEVLTIKGLR